MGAAIEHKETGVDKWWAPFDLQWEFIYLGAGKKGGYQRFTVSPLTKSHPTAAAMGLLWSGERLF